MEDIKTTLAYWQNNKEDFDVKLVAREETGCCAGISPMTGQAGDGAPCEE